MRTCDHPSPDRSRQTARIAEYAAKAVRRQDKISPPDGEDFGRCAPVGARRYRPCTRSEEHTSELQSLMRISYAVFCLKKKTTGHTAHAAALAPANQQTEIRRTH